MNIGSWGGGEGMGIPIPSPEGNKGEAKRMLRSVGSTVTIYSPVTWPLSTIVCV